MKQLTELKDGQKVLVAFTVSTITNDCKYLPNDKITQEIYDFEEVMNQKSEKMDEEELRHNIKELLEKWKHDYSKDSDELFLQTIFELVKSVAIQEKLVLPEIGKEYEVSRDGHNWIKINLHSYYTIDKNMIYGNYCHIRPIQQSEEELKAIELLKSLGYECTRTKNR